MTDSPKDELQALLAAFVAEVAAAPEGLGEAQLKSAEIVEKLERLLDSEATAERPAVTELGGDPPDEPES